MIVLALGHAELHEDRGHVLLHRALGSGTCSGADAPLLGSAQNGPPIQRTFEAAPRLARGRCCGGGAGRGGSTFEHQGEHERTEEDALRAMHSDADERTAVSLRGFGDDKGDNVLGSPPRLFPDSDCLDRPGAERSARRQRQGE